MTGVTAGRESSHKYLNIAKYLDGAKSTDILRDSWRRLFLLQNEGLLVYVLILIKNYSSKITAS